jgi:hypothetical protein
MFNIMRSGICRFCQPPLTVFSKWSMNRAQCLKRPSEEVASDLNKPPKRQNSGCRSGQLPKAAEIVSHPLYRQCFSSQPQGTLTLEAVRFTVSPRTTDASPNYPSPSTSLPWVISLRDVPLNGSLPGLSTPQIADWARLCRTGLGRSCHSKMGHQQGIVE